MQTLKRHRREAGAPGVPKEPSPLSKCPIYHLTYVWGFHNECPWGFKSQSSQLHASAAIEAAMGENPGRHNRITALQLEEQRREALLFGLLHFSCDSTVVPRCLSTAEGMTGQSHLLGVDWAEGGGATSERKAYKYEICSELSADSIWKLGEQIYGCLGIFM